MTVGFWTNWDNDLDNIEHIEHLRFEIAVLKNRYMEHSTGHLRTAVSVLEDRIKELTPTPRPKREFVVTVTKRNSLTYQSYDKHFETSNEAWNFYDEMLSDVVWMPSEPVTIRK